MLPSYHFEVRLVLGSSLGELEDDTAAGQTPVDLGVGIEPVVNTATLLLVEDDLEGLGTVLLGAETLADDLDGVDEVGQDGIVDSGEGARTRALLLLVVARAGGALGAGENAARSKDQHVAVGELLLELTGKAAGRTSQNGSNRYVHMGAWARAKEKNLPLLDAVETLKGRDGDKDDNSLLAVANLDLFEDPKLACELQDDMQSIHGPLPVLFHELCSILDVRSCGDWARSKSARSSTPDLPSLHTFDQFPIEARRHGGRAGSGTGVRGFGS